MIDPATDERSDAELIAAYLGGDGLAFEAIWRRYAKRLRFHIHPRWVQDAHEADEVVSDTFRRFARNAAQFRGESSLYTFLIRIGINLAKNHHSFHKRRRRGFHVSLHEQVTPESETTLEEVIPDVGEGILDGIEREEIEGIILREIVDLPECHRSAMWLRLAQDMSYEQIAETMEINVGTVKSRISRARKALFEAIAAKHPNLRLIYQPALP